MEAQPILRMSGFTLLLTFFWGGANNRQDKQYKKYWCIKKQPAYSVLKPSSFSTAPQSNWCNCPFFEQWFGNGAMASCSPTLRMKPDFNMKVSFAHNQTGRGAQNWIHLDGCNPVLFVCWCFSPAVSFLFSCPFQKDSNQGKEAVSPMTGENSTFDNRQ